MTEKITALMNYLHMTPAQFADRISVPRSSISHILSGRNKPSLDFIQKVVHQFPDINLEWLILGIGEMIGKREEEGQLQDHKHVVIGPDQPAGILNSSIDHVIICYADGTCRLYKTVF